MYRQRSLYLYGVVRFSVIRFFVLQGGKKGGGGGGTGGTHLTFTIVSQNKKFEQNLPPDYLSKVQHYLEIPCYCADRW